jgi:hypothetical protein
MTNILIQNLLRKKEKKLKPNEMPRILMLSIGQQKPTKRANLGNKIERPKLSTCRNE